jgi:hypothetical protein
MAARTSIQDLLGPRHGPSRRISRPLTALACAVVLLCGCNGGGSGGGGGNQGNEGGGGNGGDRYGFGLPSGPTGGEAAAGAVYEALQRHDCEEAQRSLDANDTSSDNVKALLRIGIAVCRGDLSTARAGLATLDRPLTGSNTWFICELYRASASVAYQRPRPTYGTCPAPPPDPSDSSSSGGGESSGPEGSTGPSDSPESSSGTGT